MKLKQDRYYIDIVNPSAFEAWLNPRITVRVDYISRLGENLNYSRNFSSVSDAKDYAEESVRLFPETEDWTPEVELSLSAAIMLEKEKSESTYE